ncbi:hypothetical protein N5853_09540 [Bartonella sp. HY329]|uniref:hypothetical protein n=1 Tax=unclassified Bartonella TaxID=2645622 RepID=UPI0021C6306C|nr:MULTISPECIES: hypothetical protein [unclassified Bartonella]UXM94350.1 hypothetical protein N5853_09540 [Bartonella sp. HY329]UXN08673.1 hypothetical protein N5852_09550 [Bartonella sp. HY328]
MRFNPGIFITNSTEISQKNKNNYSFSLQIRDEDLLKGYIQELYEKIRTANENFDFRISDLCITGNSITLTENNQTNKNALVGFLNNYAFSSPTLAPNSSIIINRNTDKPVLDIDQKDMTLSIRFKEDAIKQQNSVMVKAVMHILENRFAALNLEPFNLGQSQFTLLDAKTIKVEIIT